MIIMRNTGQTDAPSVKEGHHELLVERFFSPQERQNWSYSWSGAILLFSKKKIIFNER